MQIVPLGFCHVSKFQAPDCSKHQHICIHKGSFCGLQNTPKYVSGRGCAPDPAGVAHDAPSDPLVGWRGDPLRIPAFGARHASPRIPARSRHMLSLYFIEVKITSALFFCNVFQNTWGAFNEIWCIVFWINLPQSHLNVFHLTWIMSLYTTLWNLKYHPSCTCYWVVKETPEFILP